MLVPYLYHNYKIFILLFIVILLLLLLLLLFYYYYYYYYYYCNYYHYYLLVQPYKARYRGRWRAVRTRSSVLSPLSLSIHSWTS